MRVAAADPNLPAYLDQDDPLGNELDREIARLTLLIETATALRDNLARPRPRRL